MASGGSIPFQLRPNKYVERLLFMELLEYVNAAFGLSDGAYISMGGLSLEDHRLFHERFKSTNLVSIDKERVAISRQEFNRAFPFIDCQLLSTADLIEDFDDVVADTGSPGPVVIWLDFTSPRERNAQLREVQDLVARLTSGSIVKVSLNANPETLATREGRPFEDFQREAAGFLQDQLGEYSPAEQLNPEEMHAAGVANILLDAVRIASLAGASGTTHTSVWPLASFRYTDGFHQMLTTTFMIATEDDWDALTGAGFLDWEFARASWNEAQPIKVPNLTVKEQLLIAEYVGQSDAQTCVADLPFELHTETAEAVRQVEEYFRHYLRYPTFVPVSL